MKDFLSAWSINYWEKYIKNFPVWCVFINLSLLVCQILLYIFWDYVIKYI